MTRFWPGLLGMAQVVQPETILRWHRAGFRVFWHWKSRNRAGRPKIDRGLRDLIQRMSSENRLWGASRIHGELLMLGFEVAQSTVSKYMARPQKPPSQTWKTFLRNHAEEIAAIDMCVVPTVSFERLFAFLVLGHGRRQLLWFEVARHPTAEWLARQITEAFPWTSAPAYLVRDNDRAYGHVFTSRVKAMGRGKRWRPIHARSTNTNEALLSSDAALLCGFPSAKASFEDNNLTGRMLLVRSQLLPTPPDVAEPVKKGVDFFVGFETPVNELTGENVSRLDIEGVSGSSLWAYRKKGWDNAAVWSPEHVLQSAYMKNNYLRGKSWGVILSLLNELDAPIRSETRARMDEMLRMMGYDLPAKA